jgi:AcrR family transcriptional regulator
MGIEAGTRKLRGHDLRGQVLQTALRLFSERGYFNTSIHDIRKEAGVSIGAIYHHFGNKENLARALYDELVARMEHSIAEAVAANGDCRSRCRGIILVLFEAAEREPQTMDYVLMARHREFMPAASPICSSRPFVLMKEVVAQGMANGEVRRMEPWVAASAVFGGALRMMNLQLDGALERPLMELLDPVMECAWRAVAVV